MNCKFHKNPYEVVELGDRKQETNEIVELGNRGSEFNPRQFSFKVTGWEFWSLHLSFICLINVVDTMSEIPKRWVVYIYE